MVLAVAAALAILAALPGCGRRDRETTETTATSARAVQSAGPYRITLENRPERPVVGDNTFVATLRDSAGRPVTRGTLSALVVMPAMGAMPRMESRGEFRETKPGTYEAEYGLSMQGDWDVTIAIHAAEGHAEAIYRLSTNTTGFAYVGGTPSAGRAPGGGAPGGAAGPAPVDENAVTIDPARRQAIGIRTGPVVRKHLNATIRAAGRVTYDETRRTEVSLKFAGWVRDIRVDYTGREVRRGEVLFTVYSPDLLSAQQEYLEALKSGEQGADLAAASRQRLRLWDIAPSILDEIVRSGKARETLPIHAPESGVVVEKNIVAGSSFEAGQPLYRIATVNPVWVVASVYQYELPLVRVGMPARILLSSPGEHARLGRVSAVNPFLDPNTRTGEVRAEVPNPRGDLKPGMFVDMMLERPLGERLAIPESAVLYAGDRRIVFVDLGDGRLAPREVRLGSKAGTDFEVLSGVTEGEIVVTSGNFLVAAEVRLRSATQKW
ncbi:MAG TPA: efflux RND transporter periplasmic adaptor subunit [Candidatus Eisenbacteria bacterium]|nr:efflux RND transporter periplasmic adaptor subunit [Candidatus Eisenbacteria bacterium]